jgi:hypothetical protein
MQQTNNMPYKEDLAREVIAALQGIVWNTSFDAKIVPLEQIVSFVDSPMCRVPRMPVITEGPGIHEATWHGFPLAKYTVDAGKVYATIDTIACLSGSCATYVLSKSDDQMRFERSIVHARS